MKSTDVSKRLINRIFLIIGVILCIVMVPILIVNTTFIIKSIAKPDEVPSFAGYKPFIVLSGSMEPVFHTGDLVIVKVSDPDSLQADDIIAYRRGDTVVTHRITVIDTSEDIRRFITKGDNNNVADAATVTDEMVEGKYIMSIKGLGDAAMFMQKPEGMIIFVAIPLIIFILYEILQKKLDDRRDRGKKREIENELETLRKKLAEKEASNGVSETAPVIEGKPSGTSLPPIDKGALEENSGNKA